MAETVGAKRQASTHSPAASPARKKRRGTTAVAAAPAESNSSIGAIPRHRGYERTPSLVSSQESTISDPASVSPAEAESHDRRSAENLQLDPGARPTNLQNDRIGISVTDTSLAIMNRKINATDPDGMAYRIERFLVDPDGPWTPERAAYERRLNSLARLASCA